MEQSEAHMGGGGTFNQLFQSKEGAGKVYDSDGEETVRDPLLYRGPDGNESIMPLNLSLSPQNVALHNTSSQQFVPSGRKNNQSFNFPSLLQKSSTRKASEKRILMHVNKFVPPYQQFQPLKRGTIKRFAGDYSIRKYESITQNLIEFDRKLIEFFNARKERFTNFEYAEEDPEEIDIDQT